MQAFEDAGNKKPAVWRVFRKRMKPPLRYWCPRGDSNPHASRRYHLKVVRLPIPPPGQVCCLYFVEPAGAGTSDFAGAPAAAGTSLLDFAGACGTSVPAGAAGCAFWAGAGLLARPDIT